MKSAHQWLLAIAILGAAPGALAQTDAGSATPAVESSAVSIPAGTNEHVRLLDPVSSKTNHQDDTFRLELAEPIVVNGVTVVAAGAQGGGIVIDAQPARAGGRPGKLVIAGRFLTVNGVQVRVRGMQVMGAGTDTYDQVAGLSWVTGGFSIFIHGGEIDVPAGTGAQARIAENVLLPSQTAETALVSAPASATSSGSGENQQ
jgi:hypothetical protein